VGSQNLRARALSSSTALKVRRSFKRKEDKKNPWEKKFNAKRKKKGLQNEADERGRKYHYKEQKTHCHRQALAEFNKRKGPLYWVRHEEREADRGFREVKLKKGGGGREKITKRKTVD